MCRLVLSERPHGKILKTQVNSTGAGGEGAHAPPSLISLSLFIDSAHEPVGVCARVCCARQEMADSAGVRKVRVRLCFLAPPEINRHPKKKYGRSRWEHRSNHVREQHMDRRCMLSTGMHVVPRPVDVRVRVVHVRFTR